MTFNTTLKKNNNGWVLLKCVMKKDNFIVYIKTDDIYKDIAEYVETKFITSNYKLDRQLPKKKVLVLMKDELGWKIMVKFAGLRAKTSRWWQ